jgi:hypothetical protein
MNRTRREILRSGLVLAGAGLVGRYTGGQESSPKPTLAREVGITTSSLSGHLAATQAKGRFTLLELPRILRDELEMRVIDLNTSALASYEPAYLDRVRQAADDAGCVLTNLKLNQPGLDMGSPG